VLFSEKLSLTVLFIDFSTESFLSFHVGSSSIQRPLRKHGLVESSAVAGENGIPDQTRILEAPSSRVILRQFQNCFHWTTDKEKFCSGDKDILEFPTSLSLWFSSFTGHDSSIVRGERPDHIHSDPIGSLPSCRERPDLLRIR
jgi:hypothetical protein